MRIMNLIVSKEHGYELLDCGEERKLERFGTVILDRPSPQAIWPRMTPESWQAAQAVFTRHESGNGEWTTRRNAPVGPWKTTLNDLTFEIRLTGFGNVGLFPEHSVHWGWLRDTIARGAAAKPTILNLFGYTGGASLVCARAGAHVVHVDAAKAVNAWGIVNAKANQLPEGNIRFLCEDALKFVNRELRKGRRYDGIILDPPSFGRGASGEVWKIERDFYPLLVKCAELLSDTPCFLLVTAHSPGISPVTLENLIPPKHGIVESGEMLIQSPRAILPAGVYARWTP
jgi:23S rRNA (cytosine1962-C5)-methyltransferase